MNFRPTPMRIGSATIFSFGPWRCVTENQLPDALRLDLLISQSTNSTVAICISTKFEALNETIRHVCPISNETISSLLFISRTKSSINFKRGHGLRHGPGFSTRLKPKDPIAILDSLI